MTTEAATPQRRRDAARTRQLLLEAARDRFARDGYAATTVRDIADEAGVNVALISRYFSGKEGLFEACLTSTVDDMRRVMGDVPLDRIAHVMARQLTGFASDDAPNHLALLLRSSGDARADEIRLGVLLNSAEKLATASGARADDPEAMLRAEMVLATAIGVTLLRSSVRLEPMASATEDQMLPPLRAMIGALLPPA